MKHLQQRQQQQGLGGEGMNEWEHTHKHTQEFI